MLRQGVFILLLPVVFGQLWAAEAVVLTEDLVMQRIYEQSRLGKIAQIEAAMASEEVQKIHARFDGQLSLEVNHQIDSSEKIISIFGTRNDTTNWNARYQMNLPTGTSLEAGFLNVRQKSNSPFVSVGTAFDTKWSVSARQALSKNFLGRAWRADLSGAKQRAMAAKASSQQRLEELVTQAAQTYWRWMALISDRAVAQRALDRAQAFLRVTRRKARLGIAEAADLYAAKANVAGREGELLAVTEQTNTGCIQLRALLLLDLTGPCVQGEEMLRETDTLSLTALVERAMADRMDLQAAKETVKAAQLRLKSVKSMRMPQLDLLSSITFNGADDRWSPTLGESLSMDHPNWFIGGEFVLPIQNRAQRADVAVARLQLQRANLSLAQLKEDIRLGVQVAWEQLHSLIVRVKKAEEVKTLEEKKLAAKKRDFQSGRVDALTIILYQNDLLRADRAFLALMAQLQMAKIQLAFVSSGLPLKEEAKP